MILVATRDTVWAFDPSSGRPIEGGGMRDRGPTCLAARAGAGERAWCGSRDGLFASDDRGRSWRPAGLEGRHVMAVTPSPARLSTVWVGTEPSALFVSHDEGASWDEREGLLELPSSSDWAFPPRPGTHHVRWIACHPERPGRLWLAVEAGALVSTDDGGRSWRDRVPGSPRDTHELAIHPDRLDHLRAAAGDGFFESDDGGATWRSPMEGLDVGYLRSVAVDPDDPDVVVVSAASRAKSAYAAGSADGRLYRRVGDGPWERVTDGWPEPPGTIAPLLLADPDHSTGGSLLAADERGVHGSEDGGRSWRRIAGYPDRPAWLRGLAISAARAQ